MVGQFPVLCPGSWGEVFNCQIGVLGLLTLSVRFFTANAFPIFPHLVLFGWGDGAAKQSALVPLAFAFVLSFDTLLS